MEAGLLVATTYATEEGRLSQDSPSRNAPIQVAWEAKDAPSAPPVVADLTKKSKEQSMSDPDEEPSPICANCDSFDRQGRPFDDPPWLSRCLKGKGALLVEMSDGCKHFFPDHKQWPNADHD